MFCKNCGIKLEESARFCPSCGQKITTPKEEEKISAEFSPANDSLASTKALDPEMREEKDASEKPGNAGESNSDDLCQNAEDAAKLSEKEEEPKKKGHGIAVFFFLLFSLLVIAGCVFASWYFSPEQQFNRAFEQADYATAGSLFYEISAEKRQEVLDALPGLASAEITRYNNNEIGYNEAYDYLDLLENTFYASDIIAESKSSLDTLRISKTNFSEGAEQESQGKLEEAIESYGEVLESDSQYDTAKAKKEALKEKYKKELFAKAENYAASKDYKTAVSTLQAGKHILGNDKDIAQKIEDYREKQQTIEMESALAVAAEKVEEDDYPAAIEVLSPFQSAANSEVNGKLAEYRNHYRDAMLKKATDLAASGSYADAVSVLNQAISVLGEESSLMEKVEEYQGKYPVSLLELSPNEGDNHASTEKYSDIYENSATKSLLFSSGWLYEDSSTEYVVNKKYRTFHATSLVSRGSEDSFQCLLEIFVDGALRYSETFNKKSIPKEINIDISQATFVKIHVEGSANGTGGYGRFLLSEPEFRNSPAQVAVAPTTAAITPNPIAQTSHEPFWGIWCGAYFTREEAEDFASSVSGAAGSGKVFLTTDWSNLNSQKYYVVAAGIYSTENAALAELERIQKKYSNAYVKYSGEYIG